MHGEILLPSQSGERKGVKGLHDEVVDFLIKFLNRLLPKSEMIRHISSFMISSEEDEGFRVVELESEEEDDSFN